MRMKTGGESTYVGSAEGASSRCESLRQKNSCLTQLWRVLTFRVATKGESRLRVNFQVQGQRPFFTKEVFCLFLWKKICFQKGK